MAHSSIEWTEATWNPVTGCSKISAGCQHCYAERMAKRLNAMGVPKYSRGFNLTLHPSLLEEPLAWIKPRMVFVNSMSDLFHPAVPDAFIAQVFETMRHAHWHTFQILTKRASRLAEIGKQLPWPDHVWAGVTVEHADYRERITHLQQVGAKVRFLSLEPMLGPLPALDLHGISWVIVGGESGPGARALAPDWVRDIRDQCRDAGIAFFFKQWGGTRKSQAGKVLDGQTWKQWPSSHKGQISNLSDAAS